MKSTVPTIAQSQNPQAGAGLAAEGTIAGRIADLIGRRVAAWRNRQAMRELLTFDDRQLKDIGLTRVDVEGALMQPWSTDPSIELDKRRRGQEASRLS